MVAGRSGAQVVVSGGVVAVVSRGRDGDGESRLRRRRVNEARPEAVGATFDVLVVRLVDREPRAETVEHRQADGTGVAIHHQTIIANRNGSGLRRQVGSLAVRAAVAALVEGLDLVGRQLVPHVARSLDGDILFVRPLVRVREEEREEGGDSTEQKADQEVRCHDGQERGREGHANSSRGAR